MSLRIISGIYGGRTLETPEDMRDTSPVRPTKGKVRAAMLNMLVSRVDLDECHVVDLYCGSGGLGIEALSRGAKQATFVDTDTQWIQQNLEKIKADVSSFKVQRGNVLTTDLSDKGDVVFVDPPYGEGLVNQTIARKDAYGKSGSIWVIEIERTTDVEFDEKNFEFLKEKRYGINKVILLEQK